MKCGARMYPWIQCLTSKRDTRGISAGPTRIAHKMSEVFKFYKNNYTFYAEVMEKGSKEKLEQDWMSAYLQWIFIVRAEMEEYYFK